MMKTGLLIVLGLCHFSAIEVLSHDSQAVKNQGLEEVRNDCVPGKFYKRGCQQCFCDDMQRPICGHSSNCKLVDEIPTSPDFIRTYSSAELQSLPELLHQSAECSPGVTYRVNCNACICLFNKNLLCNDLLCPSYDDVNRAKAKSVTGKECTAENRNQECIECSCDGSSLKLECKAKPGCVPTNGRRDFQEEPPLDLTVHDPKKGTMCTPNMVYKRNCNKCYCSKDGSLRCTLMKCLKNTEVQRLKALRMRLEKEGL